MIARPHRHAIFAGRGSLPIELAARLVANGEKPFVIRMTGEAGPELADFDGIDLPLERIAHALPAMRKAGVSHVVLAGGVNRRPRWQALRAPWSLMVEIPRIAAMLASGDNDLLAFIVRLLERHGLTMVGAHSILPDHVVPSGPAGRVKVHTLNPGDIASAVSAARVIGAADIGQAIVAVGRRIVAVEGAEGTDAMLARVAQLRASGRIDDKAPALLAKFAKPGQELRADMPTIGPATIDGAKAAGVTVILVGADNTLMMEAGETLRRADAAGIAIVGHEPETQS
jgi:UDP-2,3-diacylglucosamine hydrolase